MRRVFKSAFRIFTAPIRGLVWLIRHLVQIIIRPFKKIHSFFADTTQISDNSIGDAIGTVIEHPGSLVPHLNSLRKHIFRSVISIFLFTFLAFIFIQPIINFLAYPLPGGIDVLTAIDITENMGAVMKVSLLSGFAVSIPYIAFEIWLFFAPGIAPRSRLYGLLAIPLALLFFLAGMAFAYYIMLPAAIPFLFNFMGLTTQPRPSSYFNFITAILFWIGIFFEFPLVAYVLARLGILRAETLRAQWRLAIILIAVLSAAVTPTVDPVNMALVMAPMFFLYLVAILLVSVAQKKRQKHTEE